MRNQDSNAFIIDPNEKANLLNDYFVSQTILPNEETIPTPFLARKTDCILSDISITQDEIPEILYSINRNKAQGPDQISPNILKNCATSLDYPLWKLMKKLIIRYRKIKHKCQYFKFHDLL